MKDLSPERWQRLETLLDHALDLPPEQRAAYLQEACADDPALLEQMKHVMAASGEVDGFLEAATGEHLAAMLDAVPPPHPSEDDALPPRERVGPYRIVRPIGRGGMAQVYLARRDDDAFKHYVAVKIIRRGMDTEDILKRFRIERQILASLDHPNIARLLDGGATDDGLSYFVMEYIDGLPITAYCDEHRLSVDDRLHLFNNVCSAVHYAHQNLIVHRDLKPSNILVTPKGVPKLLDFGIAKFLNPNLPGYTLPMTRTEMRVMTPEYAAPEQVRGQTITTASDVYSLGILLYELLAGHRPYELAGRGQNELERVICEQEPDPPSTAITRAEKQSLTRSKPTKPTRTPEAVSLARGVPTDRLRRRLTGDLDTIVLKALRKEPERRYESAAAFLEDIKRHLAGLPVNAQRATLRYRARKFVQRHRVGVAAAAALAVLVLVLVTLAVRFAIVTQHQSAQITLEAAKVKQVKDFMVGLFEVSNPEVARGEEVTARALLDEGVAQIDAELAEQPAVQAEMMHVMGVVYRQLGLHDEAQPLLERSLAMRRSIYGQDHPDVAQSLADLAWLLDDTGNYEQAEQLYRDALAMRKRLYGAVHAEVAKTENDLAILINKLGNHEEAAQLHRDALAMQYEVLGQEHQDITETMQNLAVVLTDMGDYEEAEQLFRDALAMQRKLLGSDHPDVAANLANIGSLLYDMGDYDEAEVNLREALALRLKLLGEEHPLVANNKNWLGRVLHQKGHYAEAEPLYRESLAKHREQWGDEHPYVARDMQFLARLLHEKGEPDEVEPLLLQVLTIFEKTIPAEHPYPAQARLDLARVYLARGRAVDAEPLLRQALAVYEALYGAGDERTAEVQHTLGLCLTALAHYDEAEPLLRESLAVFQNQQNAEATQQARDALVALYTAWGNPEQAAAYRSQ